MLDCLTCVAISRYV